MGKKQKRKQKQDSNPPKAKAIAATRDQYWWLPIAVLLITALVFLPALQYDFVNWDDDVNVYDNPNLNGFTWENVKGIFTSTVIGGYNPLTIFTFALEKHFFGLNPFVFHLNNLLLHLLCTFLVFVLARKLGLSIVWAALVSLLFGIHPMRIESVAWITERKDVLFAAFYFAGLIQYVKHKTKTTATNKHLIWVYVLFILSLFSKIQAVAFPLSIIGIDYLLGTKITFGHLLKKWPYFLLSLGIGLLGIYLLGEGNNLDDITNFTFIDRLFVGALSFGTYLVKFIFPYYMSPMYPYPEELNVWYYVAIVPGLAYLYWMYRAYVKDQKQLLFGLWFFLANVFFLLQILGAGQGLFADRFTYVPYFGLWFALVYYLSVWYKKFPKWHISIYGGIAMYLIMCFYCSNQYLPIWENGNTLWTHVLKEHKNATTPWGNRGYWLRENGRPQEALADYNQAIALKSDEANLFNSRGRTYFALGKTQQAIADYNQAIQLNNQEAEYYSNRGAALGSAGRLQEALTDLNKAQQLDPNFQGLYLNRSLVYSQLGNWEAMIKDNEWLLQRDPTRTDLRFELGVAKAQLNQLNEALVEYNAAIAMDPNKALYYVERARLLRRMGRVEEAKTDARRAKNLGQNVPADWL